MNTKRNGNPGKRLLGFFFILNLLPVVVMENTFSIKIESLRFICLPLWLIVARRKSEVNGKKLSLKTYRIPRVGLNEKFGSFFIYAIFFSDPLTSGIKTERSLIIAFLGAFVAPAERQINYSEVFQNEKSSILNHQR